MPAQLAIPSRPMDNLKYSRWCRVVGLRGYSYPKIPPFLLCGGICMHEIICASACGKATIPKKKPPDYAKSRTFIYCSHI